MGEEIIKNAPIEKIICNGNTSHKFYLKYQEEQLAKKAIVLPSTSLANASYRIETLIEFWSKELFL